MSSAKPHSTRSMRRDERGFTLLELMYALGFFSVGLLGVVVFQAVVANATQRANDISMATNLNSSRLEELRLYPGSALLAADPAAPLPVQTYTRQGAEVGTAFFTVSWQAVASALCDCVDLTVTTSWLSSGFQGPPFQVVMRSTIPMEKD